MANRFRATSRFQDTRWDDISESPTSYDEAVAENHCRLYTGNKTIMADARQGARYFIASYRILGPASMLCLEEFRECLRAKPNMSLEERYHEAREFLKRQYGGPPREKKELPIIEQIVGQQSFEMGERSGILDEDLFHPVHESTEKRFDFDRPFKLYGASLSKKKKSLLNLSPPNFSPGKPLLISAKAPRYSPEWPSTDEEESMSATSELQKNRVCSQPFVDRTVVPTRSPLQKLGDKTKAMWDEGESEPYDPDFHRFGGDEEHFWVSPLDIDKTKKNKKERR